MPPEEKEETGNPERIPEVKKAPNSIITVAVCAHHRKKDRRAANQGIEGGKNKRKEHSGQLPKLVPRRTREEGSSASIRGGAGGAIGAETLVAR